MQYLGEYLGAALAALAVFITIAVYAFLAPMVNTEACNAFNTTFAAVRTFARLIFLCWS